MFAARFIVVLFMIPAMLVWSALALALCPWLRLLSPVDGLAAFPWACYTIAYLLAWSCCITNTRWQNILIAVLPLPAVIQMASAYVMRGILHQPVEAGLYLLFLLGLPLIVAGGFTFLRLTRQHPSLPDTANEPKDPFGMFLIIGVVIAMIAWLFLLTIRYLSVYQSLIHWTGTPADILHLAALLCSFLGYCCAIDCSRRNTRRRNARPLAFAACAFVLDLFRINLTPTGSSSDEWFFISLPFLAALFIVAGFVILRRRTAGAGNSA